MGSDGERETKDENRESAAFRPMLGGVTSHLTLLLSKAKR